MPSSKGTRRLGPEEKGLGRAMMVVGSCLGHCHLGLSEDRALGRGRSRCVAMCHGCSRLAWLLAPRVHVRDSPGSV